MPTTWPFSGCFVVEQGGKCLPLVRLDAHVVVTGSCYRTTLKQTFASPPGPRGLGQVRYDFPLYDGVSVVGFSCIIGRRVIKGLVQERKAARKTFDDAISRGETAGLLDQDARAADVFTASLGCVQAGEKVETEILYLGQVEHDFQEDALRLTLPTCIAPRYGQGRLLDTPSGGKISITVDIEMAGESSVSTIQSPSHPISVKIGTISESPDDTLSLRRASASLSLLTAELEKDFVLMVAATGLNTPVALLETHSFFPNQRALMATLVPRFNISVEMPEVVFVCDRSGSMFMGIQDMVAALQILLVSLPLGVRFNICSFGSKHEFLWPSSQAYNQDRVDEAMSYVGNFDANYGGTEMSQPLEETFKRRCGDMSLEVFLLTDGKIMEQEELFQMIAKQVIDSDHTIRVFALGIGDCVSSALIQGVARAGNGFAQMVSEGEKMDKKVIRMLKGALTPHVHDYELQVNYEDEDYELVEDMTVGPSTCNDVEADQSRLAEPQTSREPISLFNPDIGDGELETTRAPLGDQGRLPELNQPHYLQTPFKIPTLVPFNRTTVYVLLSDSTPNREPKTVLLKGNSAHASLSLEIPVTKLTATGTTIHQLAARKAIQELEQNGGWVSRATDAQGLLLRKELERKGQFDQVVQREAVRLGMRYQVAGKWCSFVAVEESTGQGEDRAGTLAEFEVVHREKTPSASYGCFSVPMMAAAFSGPALFLQGQGGRGGLFQAGTRRSQHDEGDNSSDSEVQGFGFMDDGPVAASVGYRVTDGKESGGRIVSDANKCLSGLALLQTFVGSWSWSEALETIIGLTKEKALELGAVKMTESDDDGAKVLATVCVVVFLKRKLTQEKEVWEFMEKKAEAWLELHSGAQAAELEASLVKAVDGTGLLDG
ncbi:hypothetical protein CP533_0183 [Ophiocordyceps camponoti-saundersi (nom. inval.)]|nr:hypothetical protein CP533_0183 [Ophiocordyceps camponoti-saundersi (nom. inval.)]